MLFSSWSHLPNIVKVYFSLYNCSESSVHKFCGFQAQSREQSCLLQSSWNHAFCKRGDDF